MIEPEKSRQRGDWNSGRDRQQRVRYVPFCLFFLFYDEIVKDRESPRGAFVFLSARFGVFVNIFWIDGVLEHESLTSSYTYAFHSSLLTFLFGLPYVCQ